MGQFSWYTQDTDEPIYNDWDMYPNDKQTIHMVDPRDGTDYKEEAYEGYGIFGGRDFYELLTEINKDLIKEYAYGFINDMDMYNRVTSKSFKDLTEDELDFKRLIGIDVWFRYIEPDCVFGEFASRSMGLPDGKKMLSPILVKDYSVWKNYVGFSPESDPNQGWHSEDPNEED